MNDQRQIFIAKVKRFARSKAGLKKIGRIAPETAAVLAEHPEYLDICQKKNDPRVAGCYVNSLFGKPFYIGSSGNIYLRLCEHIYNFCKNSAYYGALYTTDIPADFSIFSHGVITDSDRELIEFDAIDRLKPILQYTDPSSPEYGFDKPIASGKTRETIRPDICIYKHLRKKRCNEIKAAYLKGEI